MSKRHRVFNESSIIFFFKYTKNLELTQNSKLRDFRRSFFWTLYTCNVYIVTCNASDFKHFYKSYNDPVKQTF